MVNEILTFGASVPQRHYPKSAIATRPYGYWATQLHR